jgi:hypothetical protein
MTMSSDLLTFIASLSFATSDDLQKELRSWHIDMILLIIVSRQVRNIKTVLCMFRSCVRTLWPGPDEIPITLAKLETMTHLFSWTSSSIWINIFACFANGCTFWVFHLVTWCHCTFERGKAKQVSFQFFSVFPPWKQILTSLTCYALKSSIFW